MQLSVHVNLQYDTNLCARFTLRRLSTHAAMESDFVDTATDCAICLCLLKDSQVIKLSCGHLWHLSCIKEQLVHATPNPAKRLLFSGCRCAKCGTFCDHPALESVTRASTALRSAVDALIIAQLKVDGLTPEHGMSDQLAFARSLYAFYQCSLCEKPYFGGTIACADAEDELLPTAARTCPSCSPATSAACAHSDHGAFHEWKCRYCCNPATHVCYGTIHFCDACHARDERRAARSRPRSDMLAIPCPGSDTCRSPLHNGQTAHVNGASHSCEQVLRCTMCASDPAGIGLRTEQRTSFNMLFNGDASQGTTGWYWDRFLAWHTETSQVPYRYGTHNFVSSYMWASMAQVIDLRQFLAQPYHACVQVRARYMARTDCPSVFVLMAALYDANGRELQREISDVLHAPADFWEPVSHIFSPTPAAAFVAVAIRGTDGRGWAGNYGAKCTNVSVRVLFDGSNATEQQLMLPDAQPPTTANMSRQAQYLSKRLLLSIS